MLTLAHASLLLLAPLGFLAVTAASRSTTQTLGKARRVASLLVRCLIVLLLTCALGGPVWTRIAEYPRCTVFLLDVSESLAPGAAEKALQELRPRWDREVAAGHRCALVAFAGTAKVVVPPSSLPLPAVALPPLRRGATDVARAIETARTLFQEQAANRVVLLTDGLDSTQPARAIELPAGAIGIPLGDPERLEAAVAQVQAPLAVRSGEPFDVRVLVSTNRACEISLSAVLDETLLPDASLKFSAPGPGRHLVVLPHLQQKAAFAVGVRKLLVMAQAAGDREPRNNSGWTAITVTGKPKVLLVQGSPADGEFLARLLQGQDIDFDRRSPAELATRTDSLDEFVAVVLAGVPRDQLPAPAVAALRSYVEHTGGGLWVVGSAALQGPAGYAGSDLEKLLPLAFTEAAGPTAKPPPKDPPPTPPQPPPPTPPDPEEAKTQKVLAPTVALLLIVDKSGSMAGRNIEIVKEACIATAKALTPRDVVGVLAFDVVPRPILEFTEAERIEYIEQRILRLLADGGTRIQPALEFALHMFQADGRASRCAVKHAILLSDGDTPPADHETIIRKMADAGITVSTVCVSGAKFDPNLMASIASWGRGKFKFAPSFDQVPQFILQEAQRVIATVPRGDRKPPPAIPPEPPKATPDVKPPTPPKPEEPPPLQAVVLKEPHEAFVGIDGKSLPGIRGRLGANPRPKTDVPLTTAEGHPVLAFGRLGLGKTAVWTSDLSGNWGAEWPKWKDAPKLFAQLVRYASGSGPDAELAGRVRVTREGSRATLRIDPAGSGGAIAVLDADGRPLPSDPDARGEGRVALPVDAPGELRKLLLQREDGKKLPLGSVRGCDEEFAPADPSRDLFANGLASTTWDALDGKLRESRISGEERRDLTPWLIIAALFLLPLDVALRRVMTR